MDSVRFCIAMEPLAIYLLVLGLINLRSYPTVVSGVRDVLGLGLGISGLMIVGPLDLFLPEGAAYRFGAYAWLLMLGLYGLGLVLVLMLIRPRLVVYNVQVEQLRTILSEVVEQIDVQAHWAADTVLTSAPMMQFHIECSGVLGNAQLVSVGARQDLEEWRKLELRLQTALRQAARRHGVKASSARGVGLIACATVIFCFIAFSITDDAASVSQSLVDLLRLET